MKRSSSFIKRKIALFLVLLLSIESFAAVVGDNDGAAFITKAEFDSMKNDFQSQLDRYNSSLDNKIDGAIAAYLSGVQVSKQIKVKSLLDEKGVYGSLTTKWSSSTTAVFDNVSQKKCEFEWNYIVSEWAHQLDTATVVKEIFYANASNPKAYNLADDGYYKTSKVATYSYVNESGSVVRQRCYQRTAANVKLFFTTLEYHSIIKYADSENWGPWGLWTTMGKESNNKLMRQGTTNQAIQSTNYASTTMPRGGNTPTYLNFAVFSINTNEEPQRVEYNIVCPMSSKQDYFWNQDDHTSYVREEETHSKFSYPTSFSLDLPPIAEGSDYYGWAKNPARKFNTIRPRIYTWLYAPWLEHHTTHNEMILYDWKTVNKNNQKIKNGLILCEVEQTGKLIVECESDFVGKVYFYPNVSPTNTWTESKVATLDITSANTAKKKEFDVQKGDYIWMRYLPTDTNAEATLKIDSIYLEVV